MEKRYNTLAQAINAHGPHLEKVSDHGPHGDPFDEDIIRVRIAPANTRSRRTHGPKFAKYKIATPEKPTMSGAITKDNSAVVEDSGINASDGSTALRDDAVLAGGNAIQDNLFGVGGNFEAGNENTFIVENADAENAARVSEQAFDLADDAFDFGRSTVQEAFDANRFVSEDAFDFADEANYRSVEAVRELAGRSIDAVKDVNLRSLDANLDVTEGAFDFADEVNYRALSEIGETNDTLADTLNDAFNFARVSQDAANQASQNANTVLAQKSQDAPSAISETLQKNVLIGLGILAATLIITRLPKS